MSPANLAYLLILLSALLHAMVNVLVKVSDDGIITRGLMNATAFCLAVPFLPWLPLPERSVFLLLSISTLIHLLYPFLLVAAYRAGDLGVAYTLARGFTPLMVAAIGALVASRYPDGKTLAGIALISGGVCSLALGSGAPRQRAGRTALLAILTALVVAGYTLVDAAGLRAAPSATMYIVWLFALDGACVALAVGVLKRRIIVPFLKAHWKKSAMGGLLGVASYGLALYALSMGDVAKVAALRETSVLFAALLGAFALKEPFPARRLSAATLVLAGAVVMHA